MEYSCVVINYFWRLIMSAEGPETDDEKITAIVEKANRLAKDWGNLYGDSVSIPAVIRQCQTWTRQPKHLRSPIPIAEIMLNYSSMQTQLNRIETQLHPPKAPLKGARVNPLYEERGSSKKKSKKN